MVPGQGIARAGAGEADACGRQRALAHLNFPTRAVVGTAIYFSIKGEELFRWQHGWVRVGDEVIDGNTDCLFENPIFPREIAAAPYWGNFKEIPGRRLREDRNVRLLDDNDVSDIWWSDLKRWLDTDFLKL
jgi:hypothetical protein